MAPDEGNPAPFGSSSLPTPKAPEIAAAPPAFSEAEHPADWLNAPSISGQRLLHPESIKLDKIRADVFDLSVPARVEEYNALLQRTDPAGGDAHIIREETQFSEKTDTWKVFVQYRTFLFKRLTPKPKS